MYNQVSYTVEYRRKNYDTLTINLPKGEKTKLKELAEKRGMSLNKYIADILCGGSGNQQDNRFTMSKNPARIPKVTPMNDELREQLPF